MIPGLFILFSFLVVVLNVLAALVCAVSLEHWEIAILFVVASLLSLPKYQSKAQPEEKN